MASFNFLLTIYILASLQSGSFGFISGNKFRKSLTIGKLCDISNMGSDNFGTTKSLLGCSFSCDKEVTCNSFFYNKLTKTCLGSSLILTDLTGCVDNQDVVYYSRDIQVWESCTSDSDCPIETTSCVQGKCECAGLEIPSLDFSSCTTGTTNHGVTCTSNTDCYGDAVECWDGNCICTPGYSFQPRDKTCRASCTTYGSTFSIYKNHALACSGSSVHDAVTPLDCENICFNTACLSIRYNHMYTQCKTDVCTVLTNPNDFFAVNGVDLYIRNCEADVN